MQKFITIYNIKGHFHFLRIKCLTEARQMDIVNSKFLTLVNITVYVKVLFIPDTHRHLEEINFRITPIAVVVVTS